MGYCARLGVGTAGYEHTNEHIKVLALAMLSDSFPALYFLRV
jgi:hypothetical protein